MKRWWVVMLFAAAVMMMGSWSSSGELSGGEAVPSLEDVLATPTSDDAVPTPAPAAAASEVPAETPTAAAAPATEAESVAPLWLVHWLDTIIKGLMAAIGTLVLYIIKKVFARYQDNQAYSDAVAALEVGWDAAKEDLVEWAKRANADGKLTKEERAEARQIALRKAIDLATGPAKALLLTWGSDQVSSILAKITEKRAA